MNRIKAKHRIWECDGVDDDVTINAAIATLTNARTWREDIQLMGTFLINGPIELPAFTGLVGVGGAAKIYFADTFAETGGIIADDITHVYGIRIQNIDIDGNRSNGATGCGIYFDFDQNLLYTDWEAYRSLELMNVKVRETSSYGVWLDGDPGANHNGGPIFTDFLACHQCGNYGVFIADCTDSVFNKIYTAGLKIHHCTGTMVSNGYMGNWGGADSVTIEDFQRSRFVGNRISDASHHGITLSTVDSGCSDLIFANCEFNNISKQHTTVYCGIYNAATYSVFTGLSFHASGAYATDYCINEDTPGGDYNTYGDIVFRAYTTAGLDKNGNSVADTGSIIGTVV